MNLNCWQRVWASVLGRSLGVRTCQSTCRIVYSELLILWLIRLKTTVMYGMFVIPKVLLISPCEFCFLLFFSFFFFDKYVYVTENIFEQLWGSLFINNILLLDGEWWNWSASLKESLCILLCITSGPICSGLWWNFCCPKNYVSLHDWGLDSSTPHWFCGARSRILRSFNSLLWHPQM